METNTNEQEPLLEGYAFYMYFTSGEPKEELKVFLERKQLFLLLRFRIIIYFQIIYNISLILLI